MRWKNFPEAYPDTIAAVLVINGISGSEQMLRLNDYSSDDSIEYVLRNYTPQK